MYEVARVIVTRDDWGYETLYVAGLDLANQRVYIAYEEMGRDPITQVYTIEAACKYWEHLCKENGTYALLPLNFYEYRPWGTEANPYWDYREYEGIIESGLDFWDESWKPIDKYEF